MTTGDKIRKHRIANKLTQAALAEKANIPLATLKQYESDRREPKEEYLQSLADFFEISVYKLKGYGIVNFESAEEMINDIIAECGESFVRECLEKNTEEKRNANKRKNSKRKN